MAEKVDNNLKHLGLDIGASTAKVALVSNTGGVLYLDKLPIASGGPRKAVAELLDQLQQSYSLEDIATAGATGRGQDLYRGQKGWQTFTAPYAAVNGLRIDHPDVRTIIAIGGQGSLVISVEGQKWQVGVSPLCAAGTGRFLEQQANRLQIPIEQFGDVALEWTGQIPRVAQRCSVFAKSDMTHLQQKGWSRAAMLAGLSDSVARMIEAQGPDGFISPVYLIGGVAANKGVVRALTNVLKVEEVIVPTGYENRESLGAAMLSRLSPERPKDFYPQKIGDSQIFYIPNRLRPVVSSSEWRPKELEPGVTDVYLGVDVGSTSTKAVIIDSSGEVLHKIYLKTAGQPLEAIKKVMAGLAEAIEGKVNVKAAGVTGSGRYLVGNFIGADLIKNEITAQTQAAKQIDPNVTTIIELGGQDSKFVSLKKGTVVDYQMNKACAAGTGSFIDELAEQLEVSTQSGEFARLAFAAEKQLDLGEKCAAFMSQAVMSAQQEGVPIESIIASLPTSLTQNYLSKVVGNRRIGDRVILTGAVFYNEAVVSAFKTALPNKELIVPEHKEVTGAIGVALLAKESISKDARSIFKGFSEVVKEEPKLSYFNCGDCEQACAISMMASADGSKRFYYGSRCDRFDAKERGKEYQKPVTPFTTREDLLFKNYDPEKGIGPVVGIPRALMAYDLAPMLTGFLNSLGVRVRYTSQTTKGIVEESSRHAYTDSCFPIKLLHGHVAELLKTEVDFYLIPNAIRLGEKTSEADQHFACPLVQAAPYIVNNKFRLGDKLLDPVIDFSKGDRAVIESFIDIAKRLGFSKEEGRKAIQEGLAQQREFESGLKEQGKKLLDELVDDPNAIGVVLLSRAYNAQDAGANLAMADELRKLGVIPIPMDCLPLDEIDISDVTDRPYWNYERKILAASKYIAKNPKLFGLFLSNFGCGPNSFIQKEVEDIMGDKPLGQIEIDEHAAEAGIITRLEALVDTVRGYSVAGFSSDLDPVKYRRLVSSGAGTRNTLFIPLMADHASVLARAMRAFGVDAQVLPESDDRSVSLSRDVTSGKECLPFRDTLGGILLAAQKGLIPAEGARALMAGSFGPCRIGKYSQEIQRILNEKGIPVEVLTTVSDNAYADLGLGQKFELLAWKGIVATDLLQKMLWSTRPYEKQAGQANEAYQYFLNQIAEYTEGKRNLGSLLKKAAGIFSGLRDHSLPKRPEVGGNGEIYVRANRFCNQRLVEACEEEGLEVEIAPMTEWIRYLHLRRIEDAWADRDLGKLLKGELRKLITERIQSKLGSQTNGVIHWKEHSPAELVRATAPYIPGRNSNESILSIGSGVLQMRDPRFAGVISMMPHGCMPGGIVAAFTEQISRQYGKPWIVLTYDGFSDTVNSGIIATFAEQIRSQRSL